MKLMTKAIENKIPALYAQDGKGLDAVVHAKFFSPVGHATWFATEYDPETRTFFGWAEMSAGSGEMGYFSLDELESARLPLGLKIERDMYFQVQTLGKAIDQFKERYVS